MRQTAFLLLLGSLAFAQQSTSPPHSTAKANPALSQVKRIYVAELTGGSEADALRQLIIAGIDSTKLFVLTDNPERADAILKGAADDQTFVDTFDSSENVNTRQNSGQYGTGTTLFKKNGGYSGLAIGDSESHHIKERKHEAYASVRLCNREGDVLWSTTQESLGAKFRGASADVAAKIAHQLAFDYDRAKQDRAPAVTSKSE